MGNNSGVRLIGYFIGKTNRLEKLGFRELVGRGESRYCAKKSNPNSPQLVLKFGVCVCAGHSFGEALLRHGSSNLG